MELKAGLLTRCFRQFRSMTSCRREWTLCFVTLQLYNSLKDRYYMFSCMFALKDEASYVLYELG